MVARSRRRKKQAASGHPGRGRTVHGNVLPRWIPGVVALVAFLLGLNTLGNGLTFDDPRILESARAQLESGDLAGRTLTFVTHVVDDKIWGDWIAGRRITNLLLYALACALVTVAAFRLTRSQRLAATCGLLFAAHPVHVEAVAALSFRKDAVATIFLMLTLLLWRTRSHSGAAYAAMLVCFGLGLLSKEVAVVGIVPFLWLLDRHPPAAYADATATGARTTTRLLPLVAMGIVAVFLLGGTLHTPVGDGGLSARFTSESIVKITEGRLHSYGGVVTTSACAILDVARLLFFPLRLSVEYAAPVQESLLDACALAGVLLLVSSVAAALFALRHGRRTLFLAIAWVLLLYAPASNIVPVTHFFVADRYLFAPSFGACLLLALLFDWARARIPTSAGWLRRLPDVALVFLLLAFGIRFVSRNRDWRDEESLWASALHAGEKTYRTHYNMGTVLANQERYDEARVHLEKSLQLYPSAPAARRNMIELLIRQQKLGEAESHLRILVAAEPGDVPMRFRLARVLRAQNRFADALAESQTVLQLDPSHVGAHWTAAGCLENMGRASEALGAYREALHEIEALERRGQSSTVPPDRVRAKIRALESPGS